MTSGGDHRQRVPFSGEPVSMPPPRRRIPPALLLGLGIAIGGLVLICGGFALYRHWATSRSNWQLEESVHAASTDRFKVEMGNAFPKIEKEFGSIRVAVPDHPRGTMESTDRVVVTVYEVVGTRATGEVILRETEDEEGKTVSRSLTLYTDDGLERLLDFPDQAETP